MKFQLIPIIDRMLQLYAEPPSPIRFQKYLGMLQGDTKGDLALPIGGNNPMAKQHVSDKLNELKELGAEEIIKNALAEVNKIFKEENKHGTFKIHWLSQPKPGT
jgi:hypothetical protein